MQCSAQEIEEKRRQAQLKLAAKLKQNSPIVNNVDNNVPRPHQQTPTKFGYKSTYSAENSISRVLPYTPPKFEYKSPGSNFRQHQTKPYSKPQNSYSSNTINGTCSMISEDRFVVELSAFSEQAIEVFKTIPSKRYDAKTRQWNFHIDDYDLLQKKISSLRPYIVIGTIPSYVLKCVRQPKCNYNNIDLSKIDEELRCALMPFQVEGVCFGIDKNGRCLIADDMGLGKTFQALAIANYYRENWPVLIATTASMRNTWEETILKYMPSVSNMHIQYMTSTKDYIFDSRILIVSHDLMSRCAEKLMEQSFGVMIIDESHTFKNFKAKCTKVATDLAKKARRVILLSGTPALSRPSELFTQLSFVDDLFFGNFINYSKRYCDGKTTKFGWDASGKSNLQELSVVLAKKFMIRRTKEDVLKSLPNKFQEMITLNVNLSNLSSEDQMALNALAAKYKSETKGQQKHQLLLTFFSETARIKIPSVCSYILQVMEENKKFLVFAHHQNMLNAIEQVLQGKKVKYIRIDGSTLMSQRKNQIDKFQQDESCICAILSITAANAGITLTAAQLVLFAELHWNPSILSQAESRAHRIGQQEQVTVRYLIAKGTADDSIWPMIQNKQKILSEIGLSKDSYDEVAALSQPASKSNNLTECLNITRTACNTLDITNYFTSPTKSAKGLEESDSKENVSAEELNFFNDDLDDVLSNVNF